MRTAVIGAGLAGLTAAIHLAEAGSDVVIYESAPQPGGRTSSFIDPFINKTIDNGPHLLIGAYQSTISLLKSLKIEHHVSWQDRLVLPLWDQQRGHFSLEPPSMPLALSLPIACLRMPGHTRSSLLAMLRIGLASRLSIRDDETVGNWLAKFNIPIRLLQDMLEPVCFGAMNESLASANARTFARVLRESFANHQSARLGWFNKPLSEGLIAPLVEKLKTLGVDVRCRSRIRQLNYEKQEVSIQGERFDAIVMAVPPRALQQILDKPVEVKTEAICNIHMWFQDDIKMQHPFVGVIGGWCHWFFNITKQMQDKKTDYNHICAVISAESSSISTEETIHKAWQELKAILNRPELTKPVHARIVRIKDATNLVHTYPQKAIHPRIFNASEAPSPGELPATIELAVQRGEKVAREALSS
ncbi:MAG: FAD-dependent oxidoreductase [Mariprofundaceae bacterium]